MIRAGVRTGHNTGISIGPIGFLLLAPFMGVYLMLWFIVQFIRIVGTIISDLSRIGERY